MVKVLQKIIDKTRRAIGLFKFPSEVHKVVQASINGYNILVLANEVVGREINSVGHYEKQDSAFLSKIIRPTDVCVDVGANVGYYTLLMARHARYGAVHAFEPIALNYHLLCASVALNNFANISINQYAVGDQNGETFFSETSDSAFSSIVDLGLKPVSTTFKTKLITLDDYCAKNNIKKIDVMKVDVEGSEFDVIHGAKILFEKLESRPRVVMLELWDAFQKKYNSSIGQVIDQMTIYGYTAFYIDENSKLQKFGMQHFNVIPNIFFCASDVASI